MIEKHDELLRLITHDPSIFWNYFVYIPTGKVSTNVGIETSMELLKQNRSHLICNPRQCYSSTYLAAIHLWIDLFRMSDDSVPTVVHIGKDLGDRQMHEIRVNEMKRIFMMTNKDLIPKEGVHYPAFPFTSSIEQIILVDDFEFIPERDLDTLLDDIIPDSIRYIVIGASVPNRNLDPEYRERINTLFTTVHNEDELLAYKRNPNMKYPRLLFPLERFFTPEQIEEHKKALYDEASIKTELYREI